MDDRTQVPATCYFCDLHGPACPHHGATDLKRLHAEIERLRDENERLREGIREAVEGLGRADAYDTPLYERLTALLPAASGG